MDQVISLDDGRKAVIFEEENRLYLGILSRRKSGIQMIANDYKEGLCSIYLENTIFFIYLNVFHEIILDSIPKRSRMTLLQENEQYSCFSQLVLFRKRMMLFFQQYNFKTKHFEICALELEGERKQYAVCEMENKIIEYQVSEEKGMVQLICRQGEKNLSYQLQENGKWKAVEKEEDLHKNEEYICQMKELEERLHQEERKCGKIKEEYEKKLKEIQEEHKRQMTWVQKQYQDLENTAKQLQKVGRMWRDKYFSKDGREQ